jgi:hypothetical protein
MFDYVRPPTEELRAYAARLYVRRCEAVIVGFADPDHRIRRSAQQMS